uniref:Endoplasmic reticulum-golgi intermediate compartment protein 3-like n=1 Tax=Tetraselmis sp. GSL018 TaxID=582737 RepID=A0A061R484_9CHLO|mmetsp:Transcript_25964/g.61732  ORF Transcript_25964/g.61732 Transcript_25964/m.61732 type:complete len:387 (-) Transcript_25964:428-1588(-)
MADILSKIKRLDAYPKVQEDFFNRTLSGGIITIVSSLIMFLLFVSELSLFLKVQTSHELSVDVSRGEQLNINVDVTFPRMPCSWMSLDAMDISGDLHLDVDHNVYRRRLSAEGLPLDDGERHHVGPSEQVNASAADTPECGSCYGANDKDDQCCNTCDEVREAYRRKGWALVGLDGIVQCDKEGFHNRIKEQAGEGCHIWGSIAVNKVAGNIHFAPGKSFQQGHMHVHDLLPFNTDKFDLSHTIHKLSFGGDFPGVVNPLDGIRVDQATDPMAKGQTGMFQYFLKVVPTIYTDINNHTIHSNQFSVTENFKPSQVQAGRNLPGVFFFYDLSPIKVVYSETRSSFVHFITGVCAIIGGIFTVSGIVDAFVYHGEKAIRKKIELGKLS